MKHYLKHIAYGLFLSLLLSLSATAQITGGGGMGGSPQAPSSNSGTGDYTYNHTFMQIKFGSESYYEGPLFGLNVGGSFSLFQANAFILGGRVELNHYFAEDFEPFELNLDLGLMAVWDIGNGSFLEAGPIIVPSLFDEYEEAILKTGFAARYRYKSFLLSFEQQGGTISGEEYGGVDESFSQTLFGIGFSF
jgi:hypothetical protein